MQAFLLSGGFHSCAYGLRMFSIPVLASLCLGAILCIMASFEVNKTFIIPLKNASSIVGLSKLHTGGWVMLPIAINTSKLEFFAFRCK